MKRSEMVDIIAHQLFCRSNAMILTENMILESHKFKHFYIKDAESILNVIEKGGMLPPAKADLECAECNNGYLIFEWEYE